MNNSWLMLLKEGNRVHGGNLGYEDQLEHFYSWDTTVQNFDKPSSGDKIVIWNGKILLGVSIIEAITIEAGIKKIRRCPECNLTDVRERKTKALKFRCATKGCGKEFDPGKIEEKNVKNYRTKHDKYWCDLSGELDAKILRNLCKKPKIQFSIREFKWDEFVNCMSPDFRPKLDDIQGTSENWRKGGHKKVIARMRIGQNQFRNELKSRFGSVCALSGETPIQALDAAHLYSYAKIEEHIKEAGFLLRKDLHGLFDRGLILVNPKTLKIHLDIELRKYHQYSNLHNKGMAVKVSSREVKWLTAHWNQYQKNLDDENPK